jgi:hypothetical protein
MQNTWIIRIAAAIGVGLVLWPAQQGQAAGAGPFDGAWNVDIDCPDVGDVKACDRRFPAEVSSGVVSGHFQSTVSEAMGNLSGRIRPDGEALLTVVGKTGWDPYSIGHVGPGTKIHYTANVKFDAHSGFGKRNEQRACTLTFTKG